jgi:catechol 2,3-dioxygenase-like lactoylglutathione lyase family enzyme
VTSSFDLVTLDVPEPAASAVFWSAALALLEVEREDDGRWIVLADSSGVRRLGLQRGNPRGGGVHLDLRCDPGEFDAEVARLCALGASQVQPTRREPYGCIANLADPDGYSFDLCAYL